MKIENARSIKTKVAKLQKMGRLLSSIIMPNIGAFITWGLLSALFLPNGWWPNAALANIVTSMSIYLLPTLIGYTGGKVVYGHRGGVLGAIAAMGMTVGSAIPMFLGAMLVGPLAGWLIKKFDNIFDKKIPKGFEMLVNNFSTGILGCILAVTAFAGVSPVVAFLVHHLGIMVDQVIVVGALPLAALIIEPAKILFLNNAINHGILNPLAMEQAVQTGKSILFLLETNPGPGLGILLAYWLHAKGKVKQTAPGAIIIHSLGGIHEIYFPYILMQPKLLLALICGSASGLFVFTAFGAGLVAVPSPGSLVALMAMTPKGGAFGVLAGVGVSTGVSFGLGLLLINRSLYETSQSELDGNESSNNDELSNAKEALALLKESNPLIGYNSIPTGLETLAGIQTIAVACDAGMGSSVMGASTLRRHCDEADVIIDVKSCAIDELDNSVDLVITHETLGHRAHIKLPDAAHIFITDFINTGVYKQIASQFVAEKVQSESQQNLNNIIELDILVIENIKLGLGEMTKEEAIAFAGSLLYQSGYVELGYISAMHEREQDCSTYMANGVAIPHGTAQARQMVQHTGMCILQFPNGIDFDGNTAHLIVGIAAIDNKHLQLLSRLASVIENEELIQTLRTTSDQEYVFSCFTQP